jgi:hypothetical protein
MSERRIDIDRLEIRLRGVSAETARAAVGDLHRELIGQLSGSRRQGPVGPRTGHIDRVDSGAVRLASGATPSELRRTIASQIAGSIRSTSRSRSRE